MYELLSKWKQKLNKPEKQTKETKCNNQVCMIFKPSFLYLPQSFRFLSIQMNSFWTLIDSKKISA